MAVKRLNLFGSCGTGLPKSLLEGWRDAQDMYARRVEEAPWAFNERASISFLAAGCWLKGGVAIEEYSTEKARTDRRYSSNRNGRCDLYLRIGKAEINCEAKWRELAIPHDRKWNVASGISALRASLAAAKNDASKLLKGFAKTRRGLLFVYVYHEGEKNDLPTLGDVQTLVTTVKTNLSEIGASGLAWHFRKDQLKARNGPTRDGKYWWETGTLLLIGRPRRTK